MKRAAHARVVLLAVVAAAFRSAAAADDGAALVHKHACDLCHAPHEAGAGPSWAEVAAKYRGDPRGVDAVVAIVKKGRHGGGPWPMPPLPQVTDAEARRIADYVLAVRP
jgi:cytochrome c